MKKDIFEAGRLLSMFVILGTVALISGCATHRMPLFANTVSSPPPLAGKSVAVLPPFSVGSESNIAIEAQKSMNTIFAEDIAGIHFTTGTPVLEQMRQQPDTFTILYTKMTKGLPQPFKQAEVVDANVPNEQSSPTKDGEPKQTENLKGTMKQLIDSNTIAGVARDATYQISMIHADTASSLVPQLLEPSLIDQFKSDYVLFSIPFGNYVQTSRTIALYGLIPIMGSGDMWRTPQGLFALYERKSGQKVWEGQIGLVGGNPVDGNISEMSQIVIGATYLLTGDTETSMARILALSAPK